MECNLDDSTRGFFLYVGAGFDLEPLINLSHVYSEFYFVDIDESYGDINVVQHNLSSKITDKYEGKLTFVSGEESYIDKNQIKTHSPVFQNRYWTDNGFQNLVEKSSYSTYTAIVRRCINAYEKEIKIKFIHGEGLTFYRYLMNQTGRTGLSNNNMICTIQTGVLEDLEKGLITEFFDTYSEVKPKYWMWGYDPENHSRMLSRRVNTIYSFEFWSSGKFYTKSDYRYVFIDNLSQESVANENLSFILNSKEISIDFQLNSRKISAIRPLVNKGELDKLITFRPDVLPEDQSFIVRPTSIDAIEDLLGEFSDKSQVILEFWGKFFPADYIHYLMWLFERNPKSFPNRLRITNVEMLNIRNTVFEAQIK